MMSDEIESLCVDRLREAYNPATGLFDRQLRRGTWGPTRGAEGLTSTAIALIGLSRAGVALESLGVDPARSHEALGALAGRHRHGGALGLVLWSNCVTAGPPPGTLLKRLGLGPGDVVGLSRRFQTMELAWLLAGLAHEQARETAWTTMVMRAVRDEMLARYNTTTRTFCHATIAAPPVRRIRRWVANFADQIYSIQALALVSIIDADERGRCLETAVEAAGHLALQQGPLGQWWWHYDARDGRVAQAYPVYSVHQYGMAPMAFISLARAGGPASEDLIARSRRWVDSNELGQCLVDRDAGTIWRDIERAEGPSLRQIRRAGAVVGIRDGTTVAPRHLRINRETRPYEWAWYLFARAVERGQGPRFQLV
jgi:hypothetical protein